MNPVTNAAIRPGREHGERLLGPAPGVSTKYAANQSPSVCLPTAMSTCSHPPKGGKLGQMSTLNEKPKITTSKKKANTNKKSDQGVATETSYSENPGT